LPKAKLAAVERKCLVSGNNLPATDLVRFVASPDGQVLPDIGNELPGRGAWVTANRTSVETAVRKNHLRRYFGRGGQVSVDPAIVDQIESALARRCLNYLGLARRAGEAKAGFEKVRAAMSKASVAVRIEAADASAPDGRKLDNLAGEIPVIRLFRVEELSLALGRQNVVHAALAPGGLADRFLAESLRLGGFRDETARSVSVKADNV
jgi:uncharacterized protein